METFKGFAGLRNTVGEESFAKGDLARADNIDLDVEGGASSRLGYTQKHSQPSHSLWSNGERAFYVRNGHLVELFKGGAERTVAENIEGPRVRFESIKDTVFWTDGLRSGVIKNGESFPWGVERPVITGIVSANGELPAGEYRVAITHERSDGLEGGASDIHHVVVPDNGSIVISCEAAVDPSVSYKRLFVSKQGGENLHFQGEYSADATDLLISSEPTSLLTLKNIFFGPAPAGSRVFLFAGRMYVVDKSTLYFSQPFEYELFDKRFGFLSFSEPIRTASPVSDGIFIGLDTTTVFLGGTDPRTMTKVEVANYGTVAGTEQVADKEHVTPKGVPGFAALWMSKQGFCLGTDNGQMVNLTGVRHRPEVAVNGAGLFRLKDGTPQFLVSLFI